MRMLCCCVRLIALLFSAFAVSACGSNFQLAGTDILTTGVSSAVYVDDTVQRAKLQNKYFRLMCARSRQNYLPVSTTPRECDFERAGVWQDVVYAALNDIDERCNTYLDSLDAARRDRDAYVAELKRATSTTNLIIALTGGVGTKSLAILQAAFGLAQQSLDTYYSRLIVEAEKSSVERLVLKRLTDYRHSLGKVDETGRKTISYVTDKPAASLVIRGYLRLCLPSSIEARINSAIDRVLLTRGNLVTQSVAETSGAPRPQALERAVASGAVSERAAEKPASVYVDPDLQTLNTLRRR